MTQLIKALEEQGNNKEAENIALVFKAVWNIDELSSYTNLSKSFIYKSTHKGIIPYYKKAKHLFFDRVEIEDWLKSNKGYSSVESDSIASTYVSLNKGA